VTALLATPVLELEGVVKNYRMGDEPVRVLTDFDFTLDAGEFVVVTGPSGAGKSTLLHIAGGLDAQVGLGDRVRPLHQSGRWTPHRRRKPRSRMSPDGTRD
jgi:ABC-type lipoprotein export system ATPase subunit